MDNTNATDIKKTAQKNRLGLGPDLVWPPRVSPPAAGPGPYLHGAGPTISGPDPLTSLWGPVWSEVHEGQDRTMDSLILNNFEINLETINNYTVPTVDQCQQVFYLLEILD